MDFSASTATKDAVRFWRRRSCTPPRFSSTLPVAEHAAVVDRQQCVSALLANVYLHFVLDLWFEKKVAVASG